MRPSTRLAWIARPDILVALVLSAALAIVAVGCDDREEAAAARETMLTARIDSLHEQARLSESLRDSLRAVIANLEASVSHELSLPDLEFLKKRGLGNPVVELFDDLAKHPEVFPANVPSKPWVYRPDRSRTVVLSRNWMFTVISDGHYEREALLKYVIEGPGLIRWECVRQE
ncbi:MAG: hypothetical protein Q7W56_04220 [Candidatus Latescibacteria bacterium]|nr:hypothetical protein [Candidatus Latescibacterota bacterium]